MTWLVLLRRFWPFIAAVVAIVALWLWHSSQVGKARQEGYERAQAEALIELERQRQHQREVNEEVSRVHQDTVNALQGRVRKLSRSASVRLCEPDQVRGPADSGGTSKDPADGSAVRPGRDIGQELVRFGGQCEEIRQQLIAIKRWQDSHASRP